MDAPPKNRLCRLDDIEDGGSQRFTAEVGGERKALLAVRRGADVYVYENSCPHVGAPLDFLPGRFLNAEGTLIQCANHGALFRIEDGHCVAGPCAGDGLKPVDISVEGEIVFITG